MPKKRKYSPEELLNDPSLKWFPYRNGELLNSDQFGDVRFASYDEEGNVSLLTLLGMSPISGVVSPLSVRRHTSEGNKPFTQEEKLAIEAAKKLSINKRKGTK